MSEFLTPEEVAERFKVSPKTVREWLRSGELVGVKVGRGWRIKEADIRHYLEQQRLKVLRQRAEAKYPNISWVDTHCPICSEAMVAPRTSDNWVCSSQCKAEYDRQLRLLVGANSEEFATSTAAVVPPY
mgnify:CR=1 FL=1